jgi:hypothetical protein
MKNKSLLNINLLPCITPKQNSIKQSWSDANGTFNEKLYEKIRIVRIKCQDKNEHSKKTGIRFSFDKNTQTLQAYRVRV